MNKQFLKFSIFLCLIFTQRAFSQNLFPVNNGNLIKPKYTIEQREEFTEYWNKALVNVHIRTGISEKEFNAFSGFSEKQLSPLLLKYFQKVDIGAVTLSNAKEYQDTLENEISEVYANYLETEKEYPNSVQQFRDSREPSSSTPPCDASGCNNINFATGDLTGWYAYYGLNSSMTGYNIQMITGCYAGAVTEAANDPLTSTPPYDRAGVPNPTPDYQITVTGSGNDYLVHSIPRVSPFGGQHSVMIGDSTLVNDAVAILSQTFSVTPSNDDFSYQYAVFLEQAPHTYYEQPFFIVTVVDNNTGDTIPECGEYNVVSGAGTSHFDSILYTPPANLNLPNEEVYYKNWTYVYVPLKHYIGHCVTITFMTMDCEPGGHFGYAYVDASCSPEGVISSSPAICGNDTVSISAPSGGIHYKWLGPDNNAGIIGSDTVQTIHLIDSGEYCVIVTPVTGPPCNDTLCTHISKAPGPPPIASFTAPITVCVNQKIQFSNNSTPDSAQGAKYYWDFYNVGVYTDSLVNPTHTYTVQGTYTVKMAEFYRGCGDDAYLTIKVDTIVVAKFTAADSGCQGTAFPFTNNSKGANSYIWNFGDNTTSSSASPSHTYANGGTYTVTLHASNGGPCPDSASKVIKIVPIPIAKISGKDSICYGNTITLHASGGTSYHWSTGATIDSIRVTLTASKRYSVEIANYCGSDTTSFLVYVHPAFTASATAVPVLVCYGDSATLTGSGALTYTWLPVTGLSCPTCAITKAAILDTITYLVVGHDGACTDTGRVTINVDPKIKAVFSITTTKCGDSNGTASVTITGGTPSYSYNWVPGNFTSTSVSGLSAGLYVVTITDDIGCKINTTTVVPTSTPIYDTISQITNIKCFDVNTGSATVLATGGGTPYTFFWYPDTLNVANVTGLSAGAYTVIVTDTNGCLGSATVTITQPPLLIDSVIKVAGTCSGHDSGKATVVIHGGTPNYSYIWSPLGQTSSVITGLTGGIYTITVTDANGCQLQDTASIIIYPAPTVTASPPSLTICSGNSTLLSASGANTYKWSGGGGLSCTNCPAPTLTPPISAIYKVVGYIGNCKDSATVTVIVNITPTVTVSPQSSNICFGNTINYDATGAASYTWNPAAGLSCDNCPNPTATPPVGTITYTITGTTTGCSSTATATVEVTPDLKINVSPVTSDICLGKSVNFTSGGATNYSWSPAAGLNCTNCANPTATPTATTTYTIIGIESGFCSDTTTVTITVQNPSTITIAGPDSICQGQVAALTANGATTYLWSNGNTNQTDSIFIHGTTNIWVAGTTGVCTDSAHIIVGQYLPFKITMNGAYDSICAGSPFDSLKVIPSGGMRPYTFIWNNGLSWDSAGPFVVKPKNSTLYTVIVSDNCGEVRKDTTHVIVIPTGGLSAFQAVPDTVNGGGWVDFVNDSKGAAISNWNFGDGSTSSSDSNPYHQFNAAGIYKVTLYTTNQYGCRDTSWEYVFVLEKFPTPANVFTPNGDGINDIFKIEAGSMKNYNIVIYDRWGQLIFESDSPNISWDGRTSSGLKCPDGTYYYVITAIDYHDISFTKTGFVQLIR